MPTFRDGSGGNARKNDYPCGMDCVTRTTVPCWAELPTDAMDALTADQNSLLFMSVAVFLIYPLIASIVPKDRAALEAPLIRPAAAARVPWVDAIRGVSIIAVVLIHLNELVLDWAPIALREGLNAALRFAIPVFFATSGMLMRPWTEQRDRPLAFLARFLRRVAVPYLIVTVGFSFLIENSVADLLFYIYSGRMAPPFYFIIVLAELYLVYPLIARPSQNRLFVFFILLVSLIANFYPQFWYLGGVPMPFRFLFFFVWGIYMRALILGGDLRAEPLKWIAIVLLFAVSFVIFPGAYGNSRYYYGTALLLLVASIGSQINRSHSALAFMGRLSLWIFLLHYPIALAAVHHLPRLAPHPVADFILLSVLVLALSIAASALASRLYAVLDAATRRLLAAALTPTE
jgi:surface polysaccharide O-acyltransferase-like enzyme